MLLVMVLTGIVGCSFGVDIELAKEGTCLVPPPNTIQVDPAILTFGVKWYVPLWSKYELYRTITDVTDKKYEEITYKDVNGFCFTFQLMLDENSVNIQSDSYNGKITVFEMKQLEDSALFRVKGRFDWQEVWAVKTGKDYIVTVTCWSNGQKSFSVMSREKMLKAEEKSEIVTFLQSLGFKSEFMEELSYEGCKEKENIKSKLTDEL